MTLHSTDYSYSDYGHKQTFTFDCVCGETFEGDPGKAGELVECRCRRVYRISLAAVLKDESGAED